MKIKFPCLTKKASKNFSNSRHGLLLNVKCLPPNHTKCRIDHFFVISSSQVAYHLSYLQETESVAYFIHPYEPTFNISCGTIQYNKKCIII